MYQIKVIVVCEYHYHALQMITVCMLAVV